MKKRALVCLLLWSTVLLAYDDQAIIKVTNATDADCLLTKKTILYGQISGDAPLPDELFRDQTIEFKMHSTAPLRFGIRKDKMLLLTYRCANDQEATLFTHIAPFQDSIFPDPRISTSSPQTHELHVKTETSIAPFPKVHWILTK